MERFARLTPGERLVALGALAMPVTMLFPWYGFKLGSPLSSTALDSFNLAHAALLLTAAAVIGLLRWVDEEALPRPLAPGVLMIAAGLWSLVLVGYAFADPPDELESIATIGGVRMRYGAYFAAGAAAAILVCGVRARREGEPGARRFAHAERG